MASDLSRTGPVERDIEQVYNMFFFCPFPWKLFSVTLCFEFYFGVLFAFRFC